MFGIQNVSFPSHQPFEGKCKLYIIHCFVAVNVSLTGTIMFVCSLGIRSQLLIYKVFYKLEGWGIPHGNHTLGKSSNHNILSDMYISLDNEGSTEVLLKFNQKSVRIYADKTTQYKFY